MNILQITVRSDFGGGPRHLDSLVKKLPEDVRVYMAYPYGGKPYGDVWDKDVRIKGRCYIPYRKFTLLGFWTLARYVKANRIDIIHSHGNGAGFYSRMLKIIYPKVKIIHTYHGISDWYSSKIKFYVSKILGITLSPLADLYICVSNGEKRIALHRKFSKENNTVVIYNGILNPRCNDCREIIHKPLNIVTLSRFDYAKNMDSMYRIACHWRNCDNVRFVWVGDGEDKERLERKAKDENVPIDFIGFSTEPMKYLLAADLYLSTSRFEGLPYGLIEAASVGLPIIASDVKGNNEVVKHNYNGFLFKEEREAIDYINLFIQGKIDYQAMSAHSIKFFEDNFTEEKMISAITEIYHDLINK